jgi:lipid-A-disaccharide synthase
MAGAGVDIRFDISRRGSIGIIEALPNVFPLFSVFQRIKKLVLQERPDLVILIDSQGINLPLAKFCKANRIKTVYYIAPQEWLWGTSRGVSHVADLVDLIVAIFPREYKAFKSAGANVIYEGHPLIDIVSAGAEHAPLTGLTISLCPGSRAHELRAMLPVLLKSAGLIQQKLPGVSFIIPAASSSIQDYINTSISHSSLDICHFQVVLGQTYDILARSRLAICTSGTINFEASLLGVPNIMAYKLSFLTYLIGKYVLRIDQKIKYFCMPNILMESLVIPEFVMGRASPENIAAESLSILNDRDRQESMKRSFAELRGRLGSPGVIGRVASSILRFAGSAV